MNKVILTIMFLFCFIIAGCASQNLNEEDLKNNSSVINSSEEQQNDSENSQIQNQKDIGNNKSNNINQSESFKNESQDREKEKDNSSSVDSQHINDTLENTSQNKSKIKINSTKNLSDDEKNEQTKKNFSLSDVEIDFEIEEKGSEKRIFNYEVKNFKKDIVSLYLQKSSTTFGNISRIDMNKNVKMYGGNKFSGKMVDDDVLDSGDYYYILILFENNSYVQSESLKISIDEKLNSNETLNTSQSSNNTFSKNISSNETVPEPTYEYETQCSNYECFINNVESNTNVKMNMVQSVNLYGLNITTNSDLYFEFLSENNYATRIDTLSQNFSATDKAIASARNQREEYRNMTDEEIEEILINNTSEKLIIRDCTFEDKQYFISLLNKWEYGNFSTSDWDFAECNSKFK